MSPRPFRFTTSMPRLRGTAAEPRLRGTAAEPRPRGTAAEPRPRGPMAGWRDEVRRIEDLGFHSVCVSDHIAGGWSMDPIVAMTVAAEATTRLHVASIVLGNDFRHPVLVHRAMANLDVFSGGRVELGLGAGWLPDDYRAVGLPFDDAGVRIDRLAEAIEVILGLFGDEPLAYAGKHYRVELDGLPKPVRRPHPPLLVGGGSRRVLELAGRYADIVGINARLAPGVDRGAAIAEMSPERIGRKVRWARDAAAAAGRDPEALEFQVQMLDVRVTHGGIEHRAASSLAAHASPEQLASSPVVLHGDVPACVEHLLGLRERYGISYVHLGTNLDAVAPIVAALAGR